MEEKIYFIPDSDILNVLSPYLFCFYTSNELWLKLSKSNKVLCKFSPFLIEHKKYITKLLCMMQSITDIQLSIYN